MIKLIILSTILNTTDGNIYATIPKEPVVEARRRGKGQKGRRRGGSGLR